MSSPIRLHHLETNQRFIVADGKVYADRNGDGKISKQEELTQDPSGVSRADLAKAATYLAKTFDPTARGGKTTDGQIASGGVLNSQEASTFEKGGVDLARSDLKAHLDFFDASHDGYLTAAELFAGCRSLGFSYVNALTIAAGSAVVFGVLHGTTAVNIEDIGNRRPKDPTGIYGKDGNVDQARLGLYLAEFDKRSPTGTLTFAQLDEMLKEKKELGSIPKRQFGTLKKLCARLNHSDTVTKAQFAGLFDGSLLHMAKAIR